jgi:hypothetical protein
MEVVMARNFFLQTLKVGGVVLPILGGVAVAAQDRYDLQVPSGLPFSEFKGYEKWQTISVSQHENIIDVILGNPAMIEAFLAGAPGNGKKFPDGAKMAKIHWNTKMNGDGFPVLVPGTLHDIDFMAKDGKRFSDAGGWGYAQFDYNNASQAFSPMGTGAKCGYACHTAAAAKDYVFTEYLAR